MATCTTISFANRLCIEYLDENKNRLIEDSERKRRKAVEIWGLDISPNFRAIQDQPVPFHYKIKANVKYA